MNDDCDTCGEGLQSDRERIFGMCDACRIEYAKADENGPDLYDLVTEYPSEPPQEAT